MFRADKGAARYLTFVTTLDVSAEIESLVGIDRTLAEIVIAEIPATAVNRVNQRDVDWGTALANEELADGDADRAAGDPEGAVGHYYNAWRLALKATGFANRT